MSSAPDTTLRAPLPVAQKRGRRRLLRPSVDHIDTSAVRIWVLVGGLVLYLAADGGGYDQLVYSQVGIVVWWLVLLGAAFGLLPRARLTREAWVALALFAAFVVWTALSALWSLSFERTLQDTALVATYLGVLSLGIATYPARRVAVRHAVHALAAVIAFVAALSLASRLIPGLFPAARQASALVPGGNGRLAWPLDYWNALAALMALGAPLLLATATSAETIAGQAAAAAGLPLCALCAYLTFSRGGAVAMAVAVLAFFALTSERIPKLATAIVAGAGSAALIASAAGRSAIEKGLYDSAARHQGATLVVLVVAVCVAVALVQAALALLVRRLRGSRELAVARTPAAIFLVGAIVAVVVAALAAGAPARLSHAWRDFKRPYPTVLSQNSPARFGSVSGHVRYDFWRVAVQYAGNHLLHGSGAGTFIYVWLPRAPYQAYTQNAHSLYLETLVELGVVGLALLAAFLALSVGTAIAYVTRAGGSSRVYAAGLTAAVITFCVSSAYDWIWQVPVLPAAFLLLCAAVLAPDEQRALHRADEPEAFAVADARRRRTRESENTQRGGGRLPFLLRVGVACAALACLAGIVFPLATTSAISKSQAAAAAGNSAQALNDARGATRLEPASASAQLQLALVFELRREIPQALAAARQATVDEPDNWSTWVVLSRLEAEHGNPRAAIAAFRRARSLNPTSPLFVSTGAGDRNAP